MKKIIKFITLLILFFITANVISAKAQDVTESQNQPDINTIIGKWRTIQKVIGNDLKIEFTFSKNNDDSLLVNMNQYFQAETEVLISNVEFANDTLRLEAEKNLGVFEGVVSEDYTRIEGVWKQSGFELPLAMFRGELPKSTWPPFYIVAAYSLLWIVLLGYVWNLLNKQKNLSREIELLKSEIGEN